MNGTLFFVAYRADHGMELWKSDGTAAGTVLVKDIDPGTASSIPSFLTNVNGTLFFTANDGVARHRAVEERRHGRRHGPGQGHQRRLDRIEPLGPRRPWGARVFFTANDGTNGTELWKSDGTAAGTALVKDIYAGSGGSSIKYLTNVGGTLYFSAYTTTYGAEPWTSDGTAAGTSIVQDIYPGATGSNPTYLVADGTGLCFMAADPTHPSRMFMA